MHCRRQQDLPVLLQKPQQVAKGGNLVDEWTQVTWKVVSQINPKRALRLGFVEYRRDQIGSNVSCVRQGPRLRNAVDRLTGTARSGAGNPDQPYAIFLPSSNRICRLQASTHPFQRRAQALAQQAAGGEQCPVVQPERRPPVTGSHDRKSATVDEQDGQAGDHDHPVPRG